MESVVEHTHLRRFGHELVNGANAFQVACVVDGREVAQALDAFLHTLVNDDTLLVEVAALHDAVAHGVNLVKALDGSDFRVEKTLEHEVHAFLVVGHVVHYFLLLAAGQRDLDECLVEADALNSSGCKHGVVVHVVKFVFD